MKIMKMLVSVGLLSLSVAVSATSLSEGQLAKKHEILGSTVAMLDRCSSIGFFRKDLENGLLSKGLIELNKIELGNSYSSDTVEKVYSQYTRSFSVRSDVMLISPCQNLILQVKAIIDADKPIKHDNKF